MAESGWRAGSHLNRAVEVAFSGWRKVARTGRWDSVLAAVGWGGYGRRCCQGPLFTGLLADTTFAAVSQSPLTPLATGPFAAPKKTRIRLPEPTPLCRSYRESLYM